MHILRNKYKVSVVALTLLLTMAAALITMVPVSGITAVASVAYVYATPNPIGVNQMWLIEAWITPRPVYPGRVYYGYNFVFTKPSGATQSVSIPQSEQTGTTWFNWIPDEVGTWQIQFTWAGDVNHTSASVTEKLTVQQEAIPGYPDTPLPTDQPLTWPINPDNRLWTTIAGGWWGSGYNASRTETNPFTLPVATSHILWRLPPYAGLAGFQGVTSTPVSVGGYYPYSTPAYHTTYATMSASAPSPSTIMVGRAYGVWNGLIHCLNLQTGQELWSRAGSFSYGMMGSTPYLVGSISGGRFIKYNAISGAVAANITVPSNFPTGGTFVDPYFYVLQTLSNGTRRLIGWDVTSNTATMTNRVVVNHTYTPRSDPQWLPAQYDPADYGSNLAIAQSGTIGWDVVSRFIKVARPSGVGEDNVWGCLTYPIYGTSYAINCTSGAIIWMHNVYDIGERNGIGSGYGLLYVPQAVNGLQRWAAYGIMDGLQKFIMDPGTYPFGAFFAYDSGAYMNQIWGTSYDGHIYGWNKTNGHTVTSIFIGNAWPGETPYGAGGMGNSTYCVYGGPVLGGGMAYSSVSEWGTPTPYYRGSSMFGGWVNDPSNGDKANQRAWRLRGYWNVIGIAEGVILATNSFDGYLYAIAKGATTTSVTVAKSDIASGDTIWVTGSVLDNSPALQGAPALSVSKGGDTSQKQGAQNGGSVSAYEENLFMQQPKSLDLVGVPVTVYALNSNGSMYTVGDTVSNGNGDYAISWTPPAQGYYYITTSFNGDDSYYSSYAVTGIEVGPKAATPQPTTTTTQVASPDYTPMFAGIIAAVAVVAVLLLVDIVVFRRRK